MVTGTPTADPFVFVIGAERSGTTLLRTILNAHPRVAIPTETNGLQNTLVRRQEFEHPTFDAQRFLRVVHDDVKIRTWSLDEDRLRAELATADCAEAAIRALYRTYAAAAGKSRIGDKTPNHTLHVSMLAGAFPESRFVHIIRDPRDVVPSLLDAGFFRGDVIDAARQWATWVQTARRAGAALAQRRYTEIRYERLTRSPERVVAQLCDAIDIGFDPVMLDFHRRAAQVLDDTYAAHLHPNLARPVTAGLRDWRAHGDRRTVCLIEDTIGPAMADAGYPPGSEHRLGDRVGVVGAVMMKTVRKGVAHVRETGSRITGATTPRDRAAAAGGADLQVIPEPADRPAVGHAHDRGG